MDLPTIIHGIYLMALLIGGGWLIGRMIF